MKAKKYWILIITSLVFFVAMGHTTWVAGKAKKIPLFKVVPNQRDVLVGLESVMVVVEEFSGAKKYGLTKQALRADVESRLRQHSVKLCSEEEWAQTPGMPWLYVNVILLSDQESGPAAIGIKVELYERTVLLRDTTMVVNAATWRKWTARFIELNNLKEVKKSVMDLVDGFINDYLAANPKG
ncbi:MAG: hypothetical protein ACYTFW_10520 [Planctomycetota bacterium]